MKAFIPVLMWVALVTGPAAFARQQPSRFDRKLSPILRAVPASLKNDRLQVYWIVSRQPDSIKGILQQQAAPFTLQQEYPGAGLLVIKTNRRVIDSLLLPLPAVQFIDIPRKPKTERALSAYLGNRPFHRLKVNVQHRSQ